MIHASLAEFYSALAPKQRLLGIDVGRKTLGLAVSDASLTVASPLDTIRRKRLAADLESLAAEIAAHEVGGLILGLPVSMDGTEGPACQSVRQFARNIGQQIETEITFWDERLSTAAVERLLVDEADMTRRRRAQVVDKMAAAYILQGALDSWAHNG